MWLGWVTVSDAEGPLGQPDPGPGLVKIDKVVPTPQGGAEFIAGDELPGTLQQLHQNKKRLPLNFDADPATAQFMRIGIELKCAKGVHGCNAGLL
jgi:hypothetical protein